MPFTTLALQEGHLIYSSSELLDEHLLDFSATLTSKQFLLHGCFCPALDGSNAYHGSPISEADDICRDLRLCNKCHIKEECGLNTGFPFKIDLRNDKWICPETMNSQCQQAQCECSMKSVRKMVTYLRTSGSAIEEASCSVKTTPKRDVACC